MIECRKCKKAVILYQREKEDDQSQVFKLTGLVRCNRWGRAYVSKDTKSECGAYEPKRG